MVGISAISLSQLGQATKNELGLPGNQRGLLVQEVSAGAAQAGISAGDRTVVLGGEQMRVGGDIIIAVDGRPIATAGELRGYVANNKRPGDLVTLTVLRNGQQAEVPVTLSGRTAANTCR